jgi:hypothetical protein
VLVPPKSLLEASGNALVPTNAVRDRFPTGGGHDVTAAMPGGETRFRHGEFVGHFCRAPQQ